MTSTPILLAISIGAVTVAYWATRSMFAHDPREPPQAPPQSIPLVGHIIGLMRSSFNYNVELGYTPFQA